MRSVSLSAFLLVSVTCAAGLSIPFENSGLDSTRRSIQCPRTQKLGAECDNVSRCCKPGYGCNVGGAGDVGQVCVKRESNTCHSGRACGLDQHCVTEDGQSTGFCAFVLQKRQAMPKPLTMPGDVKAPASAPVAAAVPAPMVTPDATMCPKTYKAVKGDTCLAIIRKAGAITLPEFYRLNPKVNKPSCNNIQIDGTYCVASSACRKTLSPKKGDTCTSFAKSAGISLADLYSLNPDINSGKCDNLYADQPYCVVGGMAMSPSSLAPSSMVMAPSSMMMAPSSMAVAPKPAAAMMTPAPKPAPKPKED